ncbi:GAF domain-containing protein [Bradyrhizobium japonicum]|uniref:GAF domain-containing protein n=1 Tax=Bradyrhizobium japonicum TaxID=375 RepID=UPI003B67AA6A
MLDKLRRHIRILVDIGRLSVEDPGAERFLDQAVLQIARAVEIHHVKVLQYRPDTFHLLLIVGVGWKDGAVRTATLSADLRSPPGRAFQTAEPVSIRDFADQNEFVRSEFLAEHGIVAVSNVPILIGGAAWGVLEVDSTEPRDFSQDTTEFLTAAAALIGAVLRRGAHPDEHASLMAAVAEAKKGQILLREMQHRVKNNFQLVLSSISSIKHAFGAEGGRISVSLVGGVGYGEARLTVTDNGRGIQHPNENGSGLKLITSLARQIGGTVDQTSSDAGTTTTLTFPLIS